MDNEEIITKLRLYPEPYTLKYKEEIYGELDFSARVPGSRPYVLINMVTSVDGRSSASGKASGIGSEIDRQAMRNLRSRVEAVMVGAGTLRAEKLNLGLEEPGTQQPLAVILAGLGDLPLLEHLVQNGQETLVLFPEDRPTGEPVASARMLPVRVSEPGSVDLKKALEVLRHEYRIELLLVEGGPSLNRALIEQNLVDELFLTVAPKFVLDQERSIVEGGHTTEPQGLDLLSVHAAGDELFLRYAVKRS